jgi:hypothetical protein
MVMLNYKLLSCIFFALTLSSCSHSNFLSRKYLEGKYSEKTSDAVSVKASQKRHIISSSTAILLPAHANNHPIEKPFFKKQNSSFESSVSKHPKDPSPTIRDQLQVSYLRSNAPGTGNTDFGLKNIFFKAQKRRDNEHFDKGAVYLLAAIILIATGLYYISMAVPGAVFFLPLGFFFAYIGLFLAIISTIHNTWGMVIAKRDGKTVSSSYRISFIASWVITLGLILSWFLYAFGQKH